MLRYLWVISIRVQSSLNIGGRDVGQSVGSKRKKTSWWSDRERGCVLLRIFIGSETVVCISQSLSVCLQAFVLLLWWNFRYHPPHPTLHDSGPSQHGAPDEPRFWKQAPAVGSHYWSLFFQYGDFYRSTALSFFVLQQEQQKKAILQTFLSKTTKLFGILFLLLLVLIKTCTTLCNTLLPRIAPQSHGFSLVFVCGL